MAGKAWAINEDSGAPEYHAAELRRIMSALMMGATPDLLGARSGVRPHPTATVSLSGQTLTVAAHAGVVYPGLSSSDGPYPYELPQEQHVLDPADGSQPRRDIVVVRVYDDDVDSSGRREVVSEYIAGTPGASATRPSTPGGAFRLGTVYVPAGGSPAPSLTVEAPYTVAAGGVLPVRDSDEYPEFGLHDGMALWDLDREEMMIRIGSEWVPIASSAAPSQGIIAADTSTHVVSGLTADTELISIANVPVFAGRQYVLRGFARWSATDAGDIGVAATLEAEFVGESGALRGTGRTDTHSAASSNWTSMLVESAVTYKPASDDTVTVRLRLTSIAGGEITTRGSSGAPHWLKLYDVGPA